MINFDFVFRRNTVRMEAVEASKFLSEVASGNSSDAIRSWTFFHLGLDGFVAAGAGDVDALAAMIEVVE
jgi:hypothetical protein